MKSKYYTPEIEEFCIGFEYEVVYEDNSVYKYIFGEDLENSDGFIPWISPNTLLTYLAKKYIRVRYLDREDIKSLGFTDKDLNIPTKFSFYKKTDNNIIYEIKTYWDMDRTKRENLIRVFKGTLHNYPYTEIFRGNIKNKSELIKLLKQLEIV
jgi:hypothetical protein